MLFLFSFIRLDDAALNEVRALNLNRSQWLCCLKCRLSGSLDTGVTGFESRWGRVSAFSFVVFLCVRSDVNALCGGQS